RAPGLNSKTPGCWTPPVTSTISSAGGPAEAPGEPATPGAPDAEPFAPGTNPGAGVSATWMGLGRERVYHSPTPASVATSTTTNPASSPRDSESRRSLIAMRATLWRARRGRRDGGHVDARVSGEDARRFSRR